MDFEDNMHDIVKNLDVESLKILKTSYYDKHNYLYLYMRL